MSDRRARRRDLRLLPVVALTWAAAAWAVQQPDAAGLGAAFMLVASTGLLVAARRRGAVCAVLAVGLAFAAAAGISVAAAAPSRAAAASLPVDGSRAVAIDAVVVGKVERSTRGWRFDAVTGSVTVGGRTTALTVPILVRSSERPNGLDLGSHVEVRGTTAPADPGDRAVWIVHATDLDVRAPPSGILRVAASLRQGLQREVAGLPGAAAGLVPGLAVGDTSAVSGDLDEAMKASSLSHLTAVSGANCALVVGIAFGLASWTGARRATRVIAGALALGGFIVLVSPEPSVVRAGAMALVAMTGLLLGRVGAGTSVLSVAVVILLVVDPWLSLSLGFALSAAATGALLLLAGPLAEGLTRWMPAPLALAIAVPLSAQLVCGPLLALITPNVPLYGVLANLIAAPAAPVATVVGLLACLSTPLPYLPAGLAAVAWLPAAWIAGTADTAAALPGSAVPWVEGFAGLVLLTIVGTAIVLLILPAARRLPRLRGAAALGLAALVGIVVAAGPLSTLLDRARVPADWAVLACEVGQGDAVLLRSEGHVALIDAGPDPALLGACLERAGVSRLDLLVLTHFDLDHRGGVDAVAGRVDMVLHGPVTGSAARATDDAETHGAWPGATDAGDDQRILDRLAAGGAQLVAAHEGTHGTLGDASWRVLWPPAPRRDLSGNDASVVVEIAGGGIPSTLLLGDLSATPQAALTARITHRYDVVKVAHHGSADQFDPLYPRAAARVALVTVGENTYGHPRAEILDLLTSLGSRVLRTDRGGMIAVREDAGRLRVWQDRGVGGGG